MTVDIRDARVYAANDSATSPGIDAKPLKFEEAIGKAETLAGHGATTHGLHTDAASQTEITRIISRDIPTPLLHDV